VSAAIAAAVVCPQMEKLGSSTPLVQQPGSKQCVGRDETEFVAEGILAVKASLAPGLSFDRAQNDSSCMTRASEGAFQIRHGEIHVVRIW